MLTWGVQVIFLAGPHRGLCCREGGREREREREGEREKGGVQVGEKSRLDTRSLGKPRTSIPF